MSEDKARAAWGPRWKKPISSCVGSFRRSISFRAASVSCSPTVSRNKRSDDAISIYSLQNTRLLGRKTISLRLRVIR